MPRIRINGSIVSNDDAETYRWFGFQDVVCPNDIRAALEKSPEGEAVALEINSGGGSVYAGFEIYTLLRNCGRETTAEIQSIAASAASVVACGCKTVLMSEVANGMIHLSACSMEGSYNAPELRQAAQMLDTIDESILNAYEQKCAGKSTREELRALMEREAFLTPEEAIALGLADGMLHDGETEKREPEKADPIPRQRDIAAPLPGRLPPAAELRKRKARMEEASAGRRGSGEEPRTEELNQVRPKADVQNHTATTRTDKEREDMEITSTAELLEAYPALCAELQAEAAAAERNRVLAIQDCGIPGFEELVRAAMNDPEQNAGTLSQAILGEIKKQGTLYAQAALEDAETGGANQVPATPAEKDDPNAEAARAARETAELRRKRGGTKR